MTIELPPLPRRGQPEWYDDRTDWDNTVADLLKSVQASAPVSVRDFGAVGDGITDDLGAFQAAVAAVAPGGRIIVPAGVYYTPNVPKASNGDGYVKITKPVHMIGEAGTVIQNMAFWVMGGASSLNNIGASSEPGNRTVVLPGHDLQPREYVQLLSEYNIYTTDAGEFQMGTKNPTTGKTWIARAAEIHQVAAVDGDNVDLIGLTRYRYGTSTAGLSQPMPGVTTGEWRALSPIRDMTVENIEFQYSDDGSNKSFTARLCVGLRFRNCKWTGSDLGSHFLAFSDCYDTTIEDCEITHPFSAGAVDGSGNNAVLIGAGCTLFTVSGTKVYRSNQAIDSLTNDLPGFPGQQAAETKSELRSVQDVTISNCEFYEGNQGFTSHPATYNVNFRDNVARFCHTGIFARSAKTSITNNVLETTASGVILSAFVNDTKIIGNVIQQQLSPDYRAEQWRGIRYNPMGVEIITRNDQRGIVIQGNTVKRTQPSNTGSPSYGILFDASNVEHSDVEPDWLLNKSQILVKGNTFLDCGVRVGPHIAGVEILGNDFRFLTGAEVSPAVMLMYQSAACIVDGNTFDSPAGHIRSYGATARPYPHEHVLGRNLHVGQPRNVLDGSAYSNMSESGFATQAGSTPSQSGPFSEGQNLTVPVVFPRPFKNVPTVQISGTNAAIVNAASVTPTGFTLGVRFIVGVSGNFAARYEARGILE